jgi:hypothetical protein
LFSFLSIPDLTSKRDYSSKGSSIQTIYRCLEDRLRKVSLDFGFAVPVKPSPSKKRRGTREEYNLSAQGRPHVRSALGQVFEVNWGLGTPLAAPGSNAGLKKAFQTLCKVSATLGVSRASAAPACAQLEVCDGQMTALHVVELTNSAARLSANGART